VCRALRGGAAEDEAREERADPEQAGDDDDESGEASAPVATVAEPLAGYRPLLGCEPSLGHSFAPSVGRRAVYLSDESNEVSTRGRLSS
jgi:hypothetical protein